MKKSKGSKNLKRFPEGEKRQYLDEPLRKQQANDDQEEEMISRKDIREIGKAKDASTHQPKYYHIMNPNLDESEYEDEEGKLPAFRQLTLKNLIIFLSVLSLLMIATYKIIDQIYQIQHPQTVISKGMKDKRLSMQKQGSTLAKQQKKAQAFKDTQGPQQITNKLEITRERFKEKLQTINDERDKAEKLEIQETIRNEGKKIQDKAQKIQKFSESQTQNKPQENESALREKEQDIIQSNTPQQRLNSQPQNQQIQQSTDSNLQANSIIVQHNQQPLSQNPKSLNPVIQNSAQYLWTTSSTPPIPKASITKAQAIQWKNYIKMIELPINLPEHAHPLLHQQYSYFQSKYQISEYPELPICVVVPSYNNAANDRYRLNIQSILQQNYTNYHVVFIDDMSDDGTGNLLRQYLELFEDKYRSKVKVIINEQRKMAMPNLRYAAMNECREEQLFIIIDGDDALVGRQVFKLFSAVMQQKDLWVMWTNFLSPKGTIGYSREYPQMHRTNNNYRKAGFVMSHLRAYYTKLFRLIKDSDLRDQNGEYFHAANDVAIGIPILEMAHLHTAYIPEISYFYNMNTGLNNHRVRLKEQKTNDKKIRKKPKYEALDSLNFRTQSKNTQNSIPSQDLVKPTFEDHLQVKEGSQVDAIQKPQDMDKMEYNLHQNVNKAYIKEHTPSDN